jgi:hypothetical protein
MSPFTCNITCRSLFEARSWEMYCFRYKQHPRALTAAVVLPNTLLRRYPHFNWGTSQYLAVHHSPVEYVLQTRGTCTPLPLQV